jgi:hypothetical protein
LNIAFTKAENHGHVEPKNLYHEKVRLLNRLRKYIWRDDKVEMRAQTMVNVVSIL